MVASATIRKDLQKTDFIFVSQGLNLSAGQLSQYDAPSQLGRHQMPLCPGTRISTPSLAHRHDPFAWPLSGPPLKKEESPETMCPLLGGNNNEQEWNLARLMAGVSRDALSGEFDRGSERAGTRRVHCKN